MTMKSLDAHPYVEDQPEKKSVKMPLILLERMVLKRVHTNHDWKDGNVIHSVNHVWKLLDWMNIERWNFYGKERQIEQDSVRVLVVPW